MQGIAKRFPGVQALDSVDFEVYSSEIVALVGENGAGKSTLMNILGGLTIPDLGTIRLDGAPVALASAADAMRRGIAFIHQELNLLDNFDIAANVFLGREPSWGGRLRLIRNDDVRALTQPHLDRLGLALPSSTPLARLSVAQQQLVEIAKALSVRARVVIMDEPTSSLTLEETRRLFGVIRELRDQGVSIIYISHRLAEVEAVADRVVVLRDGARVGQLLRGEIDHDAMIRLMVGRDLNRFYPPPRPGPGAPGLEVRGLVTRRYPGSAVSFEARRGEILGLAGLIGAGRTELARAIFGIEPPPAGSLALDGAPLGITSPRDALRRGIYLVPEDRRRQGLILEMTVRENVTLACSRRYARFGLIRRAAEREAAARQCAALRVKSASLEEKAAHLSGGNQQKLVLAKWSLLEPNVLIFDEPTRGIDVGARAEIYELIRRLADAGVAIVMISSDLDEVLGCSSRIAVMHEGRLTGVLPRAEATEERVMRLAVGAVA